jgi:hypothetical protein
MFKIIIKKISFLNWYLLSRINNRIITNNGIQPIEVDKFEGIYYTIF